MYNLLSIVLFLFITTLHLTDSVPIIIGHRGACGHRPENTLASWEAAVEFGADYVEIDLAPTKDHVLVASHNPDITHNTDVADHPEFASRYTVKNISGEVYEGYFVDDFTLAELKTLRTRERHSIRNNTWDNLYPLATFKEFLLFVRAKEREMGKRIGIYMETKHPRYYRSIGLPLEELLVDTLHKFGYRDASEPVYIESFEDNLRNLSAITDLSLVQLISGTEGDLNQWGTGRPWEDFITEEGLRDVASYARGIAPHKSVILQNHNGKPVETSFIKDAHSAGLKVHVWTFRKERDHFEKEYETRLYGTVEEEMKAYFELGIDGIFADQPDIGVSIKNSVFFEKSQERTIIGIVSSSLTNGYSVSILYSIVAVAGLFHLTKKDALEKKKKKSKKRVTKSSKYEQSNAF